MKKRLFVLAVCVLSVPVFCGFANAQEAATKPALKFFVTLPEGETGGETVLQIFLNERLVNTHSWKTDKGCIVDDVIAMLPREISQLKDVDLFSVVAEKIVASDGLPWSKMRESFDSFEIYANGKLVQQVDFSGRSGESPDPKEAPPVNPDCTAHVGPPSLSCTAWVAGAPIPHSYSNPCLLGMNCETPIWGTQTCTVTVTTSTRSCTTSTTTTWTPNTPGVTCPGPSTVTSTSVQSSTFTSAPACTPCA